MWATANVHGLMKGYDNGRFGSGDPVTPAAACTVLLRYSEFAGQTWDYSTACQRAVELGLADNSMLQAATISRGDLAVMIFRAQGSPEMELPILRFPMACPRILTAQSTFHRMVPYMFRRWGM